MLQHYIIIVALSVDLPMKLGQRFHASRVSASSVARRVANGGCAWNSTIVDHDVCI